MSNLFTTVSPASSVQQALKVFVDGLISFLLFFWGGGVGRGCMNLILVVLVEPTLKLGKLLLVPLR